MPKLVDHDARREQIAAALWRVIVRAGVEGASVRVVAAEAGWSAGAVRHYFATQDELLVFGVKLQLDRIPQRVAELAAGSLPGPERAVAILAQLVPLDDERRAEALVWLAMLSRARVNDTFDVVREQGWLGERYLCRAAICDLLGRPWPQSLQDPLLDDPDQQPHSAGRLERAVATLHAGVDGLTLLGASFPDRVPVANLGALLAEIVQDTATRLGVAPPPPVALRRQAQSQHRRPRRGDRRLTGQDDR